MTYNEEGCYFFAISLISERCSKQNICSKTLTARVYINKKGTPLVIGIVGASFLIPFVLFLFHMWNRRLKNSGGVPDAVEKILILFKPSSDKHNEVVATLAKTIKHLTAIEVMLDPISLSKTKQKHAEKWCSDNLILATHILYVAPPDIDDNACALDCMTYSFLKGETKKSIPEKNIIILHLPYSTKELPSVLQKCVKFELMVDFQKLLKVFQPLAPEFNYENNINCMELTARIKQTQAEMENFHRLDEFDEPEISVLL
ncbi:hypothetical protein NQ315_000353 [Exocentrus adspersus]|uniref:SEFIR domain-containing protein n=1 Tax=Exocentrus adspersus TaxID=1586481 RepID=A0AAV8VMQ6_9CUCU|nr:hypothetical protein NQ315_000353 [Exocentrus adspersus]